MKALLCPNCGSGEFKELVGKRQCIFCGSEFEVDGDGLEESPDDDIIYCPGPDRFNSFIEIARVSKPGIDVREWDSLSYRLEAMKLEFGRMFLPLFRSCERLLRVRVP